MNVYGRICAVYAPYFSTREEVGVLNQVNEGDDGGCQDRHLYIDGRSFLLFFSLLLSVVFLSL